MIAQRSDQSSGRRVYKPTRKHIRWACRQIQATWSPRERAERYYGPCAAWWFLPSVPLSDLSEAINEERANLACRSSECGGSRVNGSLRSRKRGTES